MSKEKYYVTNKNFGITTPKPLSTKKFDKHQI